MNVQALITGAVFLVALFLAACDKNDSSVPQAEETTQAKVTDPNSIILKPEMIQRIKIGKPEVMDVADKIKVPSQIEIDQHKLIRVGANVTGRIVEVSAKLGDEVKIGTVLARIAGPELTQAQLAYLRANSVMQLAERAAARAQQLFTADVIGAAELQRRESELQVSRAEYSAAKDQLRLLGVDEKPLHDLLKRGQILPSVPITASMPGTVVERNVAIGEVVQPADKLFTVADLSTVWATGDVPEHIARHVMEGQHVEIKIPALGDISFDGVIIFVADTVNPLTRTVMVRTEVENPKRKLKPAMLAKMHITENPHRSLVVPESAVVRDSNIDYVFVDQGNNHFRRIPVELAQEINEMRPVLNGLTDERNIVLEGAFHLDNERKLAELE
ncbi:efflux RND transporter periplasmic adaptor subunit [Nitrosomonas sp. Nm58]|uniref:efflux RND transporter periplasmic adaptor subunit n=1 Tax=Nitrosomonas sp. Nm58 TaxID=200126 RepID=UPI000896C6A9|nr:efflux RND transporter periplasmic adaptor subunit [Nitrosomonas sp. Nm58]SDY60089.1 membrane fusion protein, cobalt-zinc-cadmium efflux system [Nitrosomonas sp. Nm58]